MTPAQAARDLQDLAHFEQDLSQRIGGLTCMVWAGIGAGIFLTYGVAQVDGGYGWFMPFLWVPWVVLGTAITRGLWRLNAVTLRHSENKRRSWVWSLSMICFFLTAILVLHLLGGSSLHPLRHNGAFHFMLIVNGLAAFLIVFLASRQAGRLVAIPLIFGAIAMLAGGFLLGHTDLSAAKQSLASAAIVAVGYGVPGFISFVRG